jgi:glycosyltransferase involved in cell wall biosynthesis
MSRRLDSILKPTRPAYLFVLPWSLEELGGVNQAVLSLAREMVNSGSYDPIVMVLDWAAINPVHKKVEGIKTVHWRVLPYPFRMTMKERGAFLLWELRFRRLFEQFCAEQNVAIINPHYPGPWVFSLHRVIAKFIKRMPMILSFHGTDVNNIRNSPPAEISQWKKLLPHIGAIVVCSNDLGCRLQDAIGKIFKYHVIHNGIDTEHFSLFNTPRKEYQNKRIILSVGRFTENKGHDITIKAFASISTDYIDTNLVLIGVNDKALNSLRELCDEYGIEDRVIFHLNVEHKHIANFYREAALFILASREEAFPIVLLEAGAFSLPVIASHVGGIPELLSDGLNGLLTPPDDPHALGLKIRSILDNPVAAQQLGLNLFDHVHSRFTWNTSRKLYALLAGPSPRHPT